MATALTDFEWTRGDTFPFTITIKSGGSAIDLTGFTSISLCVNGEKAPTDVTNQLFVIAGVLDATPTTGKVTFTFSEEQADNVGRFYYDIQGVDSGGHTRTFIKQYKFTFVQDINKA